MSLCRFHPGFIALVLLRRHDLPSQSEGVLRFFGFVCPSVVLFLRHEQGFVGLVVLVQAPFLDPRQKLPVSATMPVSSSGLSSL